ncbi:bifunctional nicotinamidase/pyrazinamidase [Desulfomonile tiedjei]|uniref:nicotinamidase n=1 Tax=Desulfomonile tiedjei (strain ATCC 49306 / DSM 6799 / DCB-1) TaxID=706587 RepID=I4C8M2_DESTA|nr:bifunctional nicotinamidase/pyrazinamidase [Desulfomonile tiedjei]AFM25913.1 nicotinamidase-like amidase [Desulfomonile tiedjei DSM 6799]
MREVGFVLTLAFFVGASILMAVQTGFCKDIVGVIVVDMQGDFTTLKNGALAVNGTDKAFVERVQKATEALKQKGCTIFATQDWHPKDHISFFTNHEGKKPFEAIQIEGRTQVLWPPHCVQETDNAALLLDKSLFAAVVKKGQDKKYDSYSGFQDDGGKQTEMAKILKESGIKELIVYGIATDYCVKATAIDAAKEGFKVTVIENLCRGVAPETSAKAIQEMKDKGITVKQEL